MRIPYSVAIELPTPDELATALRSWRTWTAGIGLGVLGYTHLLLAQAGALPAGDTAALTIMSTPNGVAIEVDGRVAGRTPAQFILSPGEHRLRLQDDGFVGRTHTLRLNAGERTAFHEELWRRSPQTEQVRPVFPGTIISDAAFLTNSDLVITLAVLSGKEHQLWRRRSTGTLQQIGPVHARGPLAAAPDGGQVAFVGASSPIKAGLVGPPTRFDEVWLTDAKGEHRARLYQLPTEVREERLTGLSWMPDGQRLLVVSYQSGAAGVTWSRLLLLPATSAQQEPQDVLRLPGEVLPGSVTWSPDGSWVALIVQAGQRRSLCLVHIASGEFRYLTDLDEKLSASLLTSPVAWSPDSSRVLYTAPPQEWRASGLWPLRSRAVLGLFLTDLSRHIPDQQLADAAGPFPAWRGDGAMLTLVRPKETAPLVLRAVSSAGQSEDLITIPLPHGRLAGVLWDTAHAQALVALGKPSSSGLMTAAQEREYWLVRFRPNEEMAQ